MAQQPELLILVRDLMFSSRIIAAAKEQAIAYKVVRDPIKLASERGKRLIVDLNQEGAIDAAAAWKQQQGGLTIGFVSHVDTEAISRAKDAGIDRIVSRGQFVQLLSQILSGD
jgi:hypothetical protein